MIESEFADGSAANFGEMSARSLEFSQFVRQRADIRARAAFDRELRVRACNFSQTKFINVHLDGFQRDRFFFARELVRGAPVNFFRGECRGHLLDAPDESRGIAFERITIQCRRAVRTLRLSVGIVSVGRVAKAHGAVVTLAASRIKPRETRGAAEKQDEDAGRQRIKRAQMADLAKANQAAHRLDDIVRRFAGWLVDDERAIDVRRLNISWHQRRERRENSTRSLRFSLTFAFLQKIVDAVAVLFGTIRNKIDIRGAAEPQAFDQFVANKTRGGGQALESDFAVGVRAKHFDVNTNVLQARRHAHFRDVHGGREARILQFTREHQADFVTNFFRDTFGTMAGDGHGLQPCLNLALPRNNVFRNTRFLEILYLVRDQIASPNLLGCFQRRGHRLREMLIVGGNSYDADHRALPQILMIEFGYRDIEVPPQPIF